MMDMAFVQALITRHEGYRRTVYLDTKGKQTIGIGFNLADPTARATCLAHDLDYEALLNGAPISMADAAAVRDDKILSAVFAAQCQFPDDGVGLGWNAMPDNAQAVILDMLYEMGSVRFAEFHLMKAAVRSGDYAAAAVQMKQSDWFNEVPNRAQDDINIMVAA
jgi:GH24 family phage-related lysozyme (muramidase)